MTEEQLIQIRHEILRMANVRDSDTAQAVVKRAKAYERYVLQPKK